MLIAGLFNQGGVFFSKSFIIILCLHFLWSFGGVGRLYKLTFLGNLKNRKLFGKYVHIKSCL